MINTERLSLRLLNNTDPEFILELVNMPEWIRFIGDRNVHSTEDAQNYIQNALLDTTSQYWIVSLKEDKIPIGLITFMKRSYLLHFDIGFAFLTQYTNLGYAYEAVNAVVETILSDPSHEKIAAILLPENKKSIRLLQRLGLRFDTEIKKKEQVLHLYSVPTDYLKINRLTSRFFNLFTNTNQQTPPLDDLYSICLQKAIIAKKEIDRTEIYDLEEFLNPRKIILTDGTLTEFREYEVSEETRISNHLAQRISRYHKDGYLNGVYFSENGTKLFQFTNDENTWKIASVIWEDSTSPVT